MSRAGDAFPTDSPIDAGRTAVEGKRPRHSCPYSLNAEAVEERAMALAWVRAWSDANPMSRWDDDFDFDTDSPTEGEGEKAWRRARMVEEYVRKRYGPGIQVTASCHPGALTASALVIGRGQNVVFLERIDHRGWGYTKDPDVARQLDARTMKASTMIDAIARAVVLLDRPD